MFELILKRDLLFTCETKKMNLLKYFKNLVKSKSAISKALVCNQSNYLKNHNCQKLLFELKQLISVTQRTYQSCYLELLNNVAGYFEEKSNSQVGQEKYFEERFTKAIAVLKIRRGYMLPIGANAETCYQQQDAWTLALFSAVVLSGCDVDRTRLVPNPVSERLKIYPTLYKEWEDFLEMKADGNNQFIIIINRVEDSLSGNISEAKLASSVTEQDLSTEIQTAEISDEVQSEATEDESIKDQFIKWLRKILNTTKFSINQDDSLVHRVSKGIFLVFPELWQKFVSQNPSLSIQEGFSEIFNDTYFIRSENGDFEHCYCLGPWEEGRAIHGVILKLPLLFFPQQAPSINKNLNSNPLDETNE